MPDKMKVLVIGAGTMGQGIAQVFAANGYPTVLVDQNAEQLETAKRFIVGSAETLQAENAISEQGLKNVREIITYSTNLEEAAPGTGFVVEAIPEIPDAKKALFTDLDRLCPQDAIFTSTTSALNIYDIAEVSNPERLIIGHFCNPPNIIPLVEVVLGPKTSPETLEKVKAVYEDLDKVPVVISQYVPGFIANRLTTALAREAMYIVEQGWASAEDVDKALVCNAGIKLAFEGPIELSDYIGWDIAKLAGTFITQLLCNTKATALPEKMVEEGRLGLKCGKGIKDYTDQSPIDVLNKRNLKILKVIQAVKQTKE